ncbi:MAG TPA: styrene monooxygenase/indole monooxygenase family protein [Myxococcaceae bacterium]
MAKSIGIVGAGTAGLHLGLRLLAHGLPVTIYAEVDPAQQRTGRLPNTVAHHEPTRARERALGVNHWDNLGFGTFTVDFYVGGPQPLSFKGWFDAPSIFVDYRVYQPRLAEDFVARGGTLIVRPVDKAGLSQLALQHELVVVASGRFGLADNLFPRVPEHSPYTKPPRRLFAALVHGIQPPEPLGMRFIISPGHGEVFESQVYTQRGLIPSLLIEAVPGGAIEPLTHRRYDEDPRDVAAMLLDILRVHAPPTYARLNAKEFRLAGPLDWLTGGFTPVVRRGYARLDSGHFVMAVGDAHVLHDPVGGQGANAASAGAWALGEAILEAVKADRPFDEAFCRGAEEQTWGAVRAMAYWNNSLLEPPAPHMIQVMAAAAQDPAIARGLANTMLLADKAMAQLDTPEHAAAFLESLGWKGGAQAAPA